MCTLCAAMRTRRARWTGEAVVPKPMYSLNAFTNRTRGGASDRPCGRGEKEGLTVGHSKPRTRGQA
jgi:hypothetical protein